MEGVKTPLWKKILFRALIALGCLVLLFALIVLGSNLITPLIYRDFFSRADREFTNPGLGAGMVPQGFTYLDDRDIYLTCGYMANGEDPSRIYIVDDERDTVRYVELLEADGDPYLGHTGGLTAAGDFVWVANDDEGEGNCLWALSLAELLAAKNGDGIMLETAFVPESRAAFCTVDGGYLWVGEFHDGEKYKTKDSHEVTLAGGGTQNAMAFAYALDASHETGIAQTPSMAVSLGDLVQGMARDAEGRFYLSTSYGLKKSHLLIYENALSGEHDSTITVGGEEVPVWHLTEDNLLSDVKMPPMSEEIFVDGDEVYVMFESACRKYYFGILLRGRGVYSYEPTFAK